ncbi:MAG TPA: hypothetical protein VGI48_17940 [Caldimonas sp.]|jgi:hypothetical protein
MSPRLCFLCAALAAAASPAWSENETGVLYRCPGNDYNNTISASEAEKLHCKRVENAAVSVIRSTTPPASAAAPVPRVPVAEVKESPEGTAMRARASDSRRQLENRLRGEERALSRLEVEFNGGDPDRRQDETNLQAYLDRVARMRSEIARKQIDIAELRRELDKLPSSP